MSERLAVHLLISKRAAARLAFASNCGMMPGLVVEKPLQFMGPVNLIQNTEKPAKTAERSV
jgi:hypothetical protein